MQKEYHHTIPPEKIREPSIREDDLILDQWTDVDGNICFYGWPYSKKEAERKRMIDRQTVAIWRKKQNT